MTDSVVESYFRSQQSSLYLWTDEGRALSWLDGTTIAFRPELAAVFDRLSNGSLPGFSSITVALAATRTSWPDVSEKLTRLVRALSESELPTYSAAMKKHAYLTETWPTTRRRLTGLSEYAAANVKSTADRAELLGTLFDGFESSLNSTQQSTIATAYQVGLPDDWFFERKGDGEQFTLPSTDEEETEWRRRPPIFHRVLHDVLEFLRIAKVLASNLHDWDHDSLRQRTQTGVAVPIQTPESPLDAPVSTRQLLSTLQHDTELSGFAKIASRLVAAVSLPRSLESTHEVASGGVSDISNRGRLDQLLLSELAFDDLTLAVRIASNEAMYIRRESPPGPQVRSRPIFIDTSLPLWGIPKLYATAMAMALSAKETDQLKVECFRAEGEDLIAVPLVTRNDVAQQLASLSPTEHPGMALAAFEQAVRESADTAEPVLITTSDVWESGAFQHHLNATSFPVLWVIQVERNGRLLVMQRTRQGTSIRKTIQLPIEEILGRQDAKSLERKGVSDELPNIMHLADFPLRLSYVAKEGRIFSWGDETLAFTRDGRLLNWDRRQAGAVQLLDNLATRSTKAPTLVARDESMIQFYVRTSPPKLITVHRVGKQIDEVDVEAGLEDCTPFAAIGTTFFLHRNRPGRNDEIIAADRSTGQLLATGTNPEYPRRSGLGRVFRFDEKFAVLHFDGSGLVYEPLPKEFQSAVDVLEYEAGKFLLIDRNLKIVDPEGVIKFQKTDSRASRFIDHLPGGDKFQTGSACEGKVMWNTSGRLVPGNPASCQRIEWDTACRIVEVRNSHWKFRRVGLEPTTGRIRLQSNKGVDYVIRWNSEHKHIELVMGGQHDVVKLSNFDSIQGVEGTGYRLKKAEWDGGNTAWLDSRGLLHLKSGNVSVPQVTIVLRDGRLSGWLSSGELFGEDYYIQGPVGQSQGAAVEVSDAVAWKKSIKPFLDSGPWNFHYSFDTATAVNATPPQY